MTLQLHQQTIIERYLSLQNAIIDTSEPYIAIGDYTLYDEEAMDAINRIYGYLESSGGDVREAIEQYIYDELR